jgi:hypothetical protein
VLLIYILLCLSCSREYFDKESIRKSVKELPLLGYRYQDIIEHSDIRKKLTNTYGFTYCESISRDNDTFVLKKDGIYYLLGIESELYYGKIVACSAVPKGFYLNNVAGKHMWVAQGDGMSLYIFFSRYPPVPGCEITLSKTMEYPENARKRFEVYYPELSEGLKTNGYSIKIDY